MKTSENMILRAAHRSEAAFIATLSRLEIEHGLNWRWTTSRVQKQIDDPEKMVLVASIDGAIEGFAIMKFGNTKAHLLLLAVEPKTRRLGIGTDLVRWLEKSCQTAGLASIRLEVRASNRQAIDFYESLGYKQSEEIAHYYDGRETAVTMVRELF